MKKIISLLLTAALLLTVTGCAADFMGQMGSSAPEMESPRDPLAFNRDFSAADGRERAEVAARAEGDFAHRAMYDSASPMLSEAGYSGGNGSQFAGDASISAGTLTAGEWRDNVSFDEFGNLFLLEWKNLKTRWKLDPTNRITVKVTSDGNPVRNETVELFAGSAKIWSAKTDHNGIAYLFTKFEYDPQSQAAAGELEVVAGGVKKAAEVGSAVEIELSGGVSPAKSLDLMFVIDTTGSMGDELFYLQTELADVIETVKKNNAQIPTRLSVNFYRDFGDDYVVLPHDFTADIPKAINILKGQSAEGGGDYPEQLDLALKNGVFEHDWTENSVKLLFVILDAPSHHNNEAIENFQKIIPAAAEKGIRIVPIMASGADLDCEFQLRTLAVTTGGTFTFLTDHSGVGDPHAEPTVGEYKVEKLNDALVRIIDEYLSN